MTLRERITAALTHQEIDIIPFSCGFTEQERENMVRFTGNKDFDKDWQDPFRTFYYWGWPTEIEGRPGYFLDDFGVIWNRNGADKDIGMIDNPICQDPEEDIEYEMPVLDEKRFRREIEEMLSKDEGKFTTISFGFSMFERSWTILGMENVLLRMMINPDSLKGLYEKICQYHLHMLDIALEYEVDAIQFGDDWGQQHGTIMGADHWREFIKPYVKRLYDKVHEHGKFVIQHSCGDCQEILDDLVEIGLNCYQTFQPEIYPIEKIKAKYGDKLTFWGGISTQQLLVQATPEQVRDETIRIMNVMRPNGGYIAAPTHSVPFDVPPENILAMMDVFLNQDKYF